MRRLTTVIFILGIAPLSAWANCQSDIAATTTRAEALPWSAGKAALLEQIQRAMIARHEGDETECLQALSVATGVLDQIDAAKQAAALPPKLQPKL